MSDSLQPMPASSWNIFEEGGHPLLIAGPCSAESEEQLLATALQLKKIGVNVFRAGIWKPRTSPYTFEGVGEKGLRWMQQLRNETGMKTATEVANATHVEKALNAGIDLLWIGARTTTNPFAVQDICEALKGSDIPVLVKNPVAPDLQLWIGAIERLLLSDITKIGAIHRGFQGFQDIKYRNTPLWQIPIELKQHFKNIPLFCDPSHISGNAGFIGEISQKAMDLDFEGLMIETHIQPEKALSDKEQQLSPTQLKSLLSGLTLRHSEPTDQYAYHGMENLREKIDVLDNILLSTLVNRMNLIEEIGRIKKQHHITIFQAKRWEKILSQAREEAIKNNLDPELVEKIFKLIHQASIDRQTEIMNE